MTWEIWKPKTSGVQQNTRSLIRSVMGLHSTFAGEFWLWRGQADAAHGLEPGMHTRVRNTPGAPFDEHSVQVATNQLLNLARANRLDTVEDLRLPDIALLAHLQHNGAATPLLDVTVDPLVAMWMVAYTSGEDPFALDDRDGWLFAIRRPGRDRWISSLDSSSYGSGAASIVTLIRNRVYWYRPPPISERLRIQRGSFLLGPLSEDGPCTLPLRIVGEPWIETRICQLGLKGRPIRAKTDVVAFKIRAGIKSEIRRWLEDRAGLTQDVIYPTPWHRPFLEEFCRSYSRQQPVFA